LISSLTYIEVKLTRMPRMKMRIFFLDIYNHSVSWSEEICSKISICSKAQLY